MAIDKLNEHYSFTNPASIYDEEALTALELAGRQAKKINEVVEATNRFERETIPETVAKDVQKHIDDGDFEDAISDHLDGLNERVDNLLGKVVEGSTTMDAEIIDARMNPRTNTSATNLYMNLLFSYLDSLSLRNEAISKDANNVFSGYQWVSSGVEWKNVPTYEDTGYPIGGYLLAFSANGANSELVTMAKVYQLFLCADGNIYFRFGKADGNFFEWERIPSESYVNLAVSGALSPIKNELNNNTLKLRNLTVTNVDELFDNGFYFISSATAYEGLPEGENAGVLVCYKGYNDYSRYQIFFSFTGNYYTRNCNVDTTFKAWKKLATVDDNPSGGGSGDAQSYRYEIIPNTDVDGFYILQKGNTGYIRYTFGTDPTYTSNKRLLKIEKLNLDRELENVISDIGHDTEAVIYDPYGVESTFTGGVHGSECLLSLQIIVDGKAFSNILDSMVANHIHIGRISNIDTSDSMYRCKRDLDFDNCGLKIYTRIEDPNCMSGSPELYYGMLSVYKSVCPTLENNFETTTYTTDIKTDYKNELYRDSGYGVLDNVKCYGNGVFAEIEFIRTYGRDTIGDRFIVDYGDRYKVYFTNGVNTDDINAYEDNSAHGCVRLKFEC